MNMKAVFLCVIICLTCVPLVPVKAQYWDGWEFRVIITIDYSKVDEVLVDFPIYLEISNSSGITGMDLTGIFDEIGGTYTKMIVTTLEHSPLYCEVVSWDEDAEYAELWVKVPLIDDDSETILYIYYGATHSENTAFMGLTGSANGENVWNSGYVMVQHMNDATTSTITDSTSNDNDGTKKAINSPTEVVGKIGKCQDFVPADTEYIIVSDSASLGITDDLVIEYWYYMPIGHGVATERLFYQRDGIKATIGNGASKLVYGSITDGVEDGSVWSNAALSDDAWYHIFYVTTGNIAKIYVNGVLQTKTDAYVGPYDNGAFNFYLGCHVDAGSNPDGGYLDGIVDEFRLYTVPLNVTAWVGASYQTQNDNLLYIGQPIPDIVTTNPFTIFALLGFVFGICALAMVIAKKK